MNRRRRAAKPADPMQIALRRAAERLRDKEPSTWGLDVAAMALPANANVELGNDKSGRTAPVRRMDVFDALSTRGRLSAPALSAVRRLQNDIACLHQTRLGGGDYAPRVDTSFNPRTFDLQRRAAGERIRAVMELAGPVSARLLAALCETDVVLGRIADWRCVVERETGESLADAQGAIVRMACENLAGAYEVLGRR